MDPIVPANPPRRRAAIGKVAFEAHAKQVGSTANWLYLTDAERDAWSAAAMAVRDDVLRPADSAETAEEP